MSRSSPAVGISTEVEPSLPYGVIVTLRPTTGSGGFSKNRTIKERFFIVFRETLGPIKGLSDMITLLGRLSSASVEVPTAGLERDATLPL